MDLGDYQHLNQYTVVQRSSIERPTSRPEIRRKPVNTNSIELVPLHSYSSQKPLLNGNHEEPTEHFAPSIVGKRTWKKRRWPWGKQSDSGSHPAWFTTVIFGLILAIVVLLANIILLACAYGRFSVENYTAVVFTGSCAKASRLTTVAEVIINILSTLLLAASNNCAQLLISPSRTEVDRAHEKGIWIHVGPSNMRNFSWIGKWRVAVWILLFISSLPLHLLYNSVIYSSAYTSDWLAAAVTQDFLDRGAWNQSSANITFNSVAITSFNNYTAQSYLEILSEMQSSSSNLTRLTDSECQSAFGTTKVQSPYLNVLVVTNYTSNDSFIDGILYYPETGMNSTPWFNTNASNISVAGCSQSWNYTRAPNWNLPECDCSGNDCSLGRVQVQDCLAQPAGDFNVQCTISITLNLLIAVIVCNALKAVCFICTLRAKSFNPLATVGDAVASFMDQPDPTTVACGPLSASTVKDGGNIFFGVKGTWNEKIKHWKEAHLWKGDRRGIVWGHSIKTGFGVGVAALMLVVWLVTLIKLSHSWNGSIGSSWSHDVAFSVYSNVASTQTLGTNVFFVNIPQLAVSLVYVLYNSLLTRMLVANEFSQFGRHRKALRVSHPHGAQRSTYWLTLPYRYTLPLMACMALIHLFISRGMFLINVKVYNIAGQEVPSRAHFTHATSALALLFAFLIATILLVGLVVCSYRKLRQGIPILGTNSVAISSACHPALGDEHAATKGLLYGAVDAPPIDATGEYRGAMKHVCFTSFEAEPLEDGQRYY